MLLLALAFLLLFGLFIAALLGLTSASFGTTKVVHSRTIKNYNADSGVDYGLMRLRQDSTFCPNGSVGQQSITAELAAGLKVNGSKPVTVTCQTVDTGRAPGANGYAAIVRSPATDAFTTKNGLDKRIEGAVYVAGGLNLDQPLVVQGDLEKGSGGAGGCTRPSADKLTFDTEPPYTWVCTSAAPADPDHALPAYPTTSRTNIGTVLSGNCTVFKPGLYTLAPKLGSKNYFTSGVYVFKNIGRWDIMKADVYGGAQTTGVNLQVTTGAPCTTDALAGEAGHGTGVEFIFEGDSRMNFQTQSRMELFERAPAGAIGSEGTAGISVYAVPPATSGWTPFTGGATNDPVISLGNGSTPEMAFHGLIYAPTAGVELFATNGTVAQALNGVVCNTLLLSSSASAQGLSISVGSALGARDVLITATAPGDAGEASTTSTAIVEVKNDPARTARVLSRRVTN